MIERLRNYRKERTLSNEAGEGVPLPPEIEEVLIGGYSPEEVQYDLRIEKLQKASDTIREEQGGER